MTATFHLRPKEVNQALLQKISDFFADDEIEIVVRSEENEEGVDYPYNNPIQRQYLLEAIDRINKREGLVEYNPADFE